MKVKKNLLLGIMLLLFLVACSSTKAVKTNGNELTVSEKVVGIWQMLAIRFHDGRVMASEFMGNPYYQFGAGKRTKTLRTTPAPPPETVDYAIKGDTLYYPNNNFPDMVVSFRSADTLVLSNEKLSWFLARSAE